MDSRLRQKPLQALRRLADALNVLLLAAADNRIHYERPAVLVVVVVIIMVPADLLPIDPRNLPPDVS